MVTYFKVIGSKSITTLEQQCTDYALLAHGIGQAEVFEIRNEDCSWIPWLVIVGPRLCDPSLLDMVRWLGLTVSKREGSHNLGLTIPNHGKQV